MKFDENFYANTNELLKEFGLPDIPIFREWVHNHFQSCQALDHSELVDYKSNLKYIIGNESGAFNVEPQITNDALKNADNDAIKKTFGINSHLENVGQVIYATYFKNDCLVVENTTIVYKEYNEDVKLDMRSNDSCEFYTSCEIYDKDATDTIINMLKANQEQQIMRRNASNSYFGQTNVENYSNMLMYAVASAKSTIGLRPDETLECRNMANKYHASMQLLDEKINNLNNKEQNRAK